MLFLHKRMSQSPPSQFLIPEGVFSPLQQTQRRQQTPARTPSCINTGKHTDYHVISILMRIDKHREIPSYPPPDPVELATVLNLRNIQGDVLAGFNKVCRAHLHA
jgi:hypothetical protein